ncbi:SIS domain-containing protein [Rhizobium rhizogenes]|uniref:SIS domain-containing protein n=1 Tax=Rhizobium rhizogenes TaxID=359 RepID=UPI00157332BF|nr:SIS domain-containing protein [Rhizobium rhizogenes]NTF72675.1 SIS domain-containing protein [Rhizobium rhizogenes]
MDLLYTPSATSADQICQQLSLTVTQLGATAEFGRDLSACIRRIYIVSAGAGLAIGRSLKHYSYELSSKLAYDVFASATFMDILMENSSIADDPSTLIVLTSKSGQTPETVAVAKFLKDRVCNTVILTMFRSSSLASFQHKAIFIGQTIQFFHATYMLMMSLFGGIWEARENWKHLPALLSSLANLPNKLLLAAEKGATMADLFAIKFNEKHPLYFVASGCALMAAHAFGLCILQERFGFNINIIDAADFFHSAVETVRPQTDGRYILIIPDDGTRNQMLRIKSFFDEVSVSSGAGPVVIDTREFEMSGIEPQIEKFLGPIVTEAFFRPWAPSLAKVAGKTMNDPLLHMGRFQYYATSTA